MISIESSLPVSEIVLISVAQSYMSNLDHIIAIMNYLSKVLTNFNTRYNLILNAQMKGRSATTMLQIIKR